MSKNESAPTSKCALLSMLPRPKKGGEGGQMPSAKKLPFSVKEIQLKQTTRTFSSRNDILDDDDDEFDAKLVEKSKQIRDKGVEEDDSSGPEEGPSLPSTPTKVVETRLPKNITLLSGSLGIDYGDSSDDEAAEDNEGTDAPAQDFFGLLPGSPVEKRPKTEMEQQQQQFSLEHQIFIDSVEPGPSRPTHTTVAEGTRQETRNDLHVRAISDEEAHRLIYEKELAPFGANPMIAQDAVSQLVDVSVDSALGPNVRENLLKNLSGKQLAQLPLGPLPKMKKSDADKLAKRKHQITHLAAVAVSREEQLQEKWADSKQNKKMSRQKYGF